MANKIVVLGSNVTVTTSDGATSYQPAPGDTLETLTSLAMNIALLSYSGREFPGAVKAILKDKNDTITKEYIYNGKNGVTWDSSGRRRLNILMELAPALAEAVITDLDQDGRIRYQMDITPTNYSTGKLIISFSGGVPDGANADMSLVVGGVGGTQALASMVGKNAGHMEIEVTFACVAV